jgi:drug/metabolite transporter (DMT)-like permease
MTALTHDIEKAVSVSHTRRGLALALGSAVSFGLSGALARPLLESGWSAGTVSLFRIAIAGLVVLPFGLSALRGRWSLLRANAGTLLLYGLVAVTVAQFCYFSAVRHMEVAPALLIEFTAPATVVAWMWLRHGQRPGRVTFLGAAIAVLGLVLVLDLLSGADLSTVGVLWALAAMVGCTTHFVVSGDTTNGLPPLTLAAGGFVVATVALGTLGLTGLLPMATASEPVTYAGTSVSPWIVLVTLGLVTAALPYTVGIAAARHLGSRLASFVALSEVVAGVLWAIVLLGEVPRPVQALGGVLILAGVVAVKLGERSIRLVDPLPG